MTETQTPILAKLAGREQTWFPAIELTVSPNSRSSHDEYEATLQDIKSCTAEYFALKATHEREDDSVMEYYRSNFERGEDGTKPPKRTPSNTREAQLQAILDRGQVVKEHLEQLLEDMVSTCQEHYSKTGPRRYRPARMRPKRRCGNCASNLLKQRPRPTVRHR